MPDVGRAEVGFRLLSLEFQYNSDKLNELKLQIDNLNLETVDINKKAKAELEKKKIIEKQLCSEAQSFGQKIEERQKRIQDLRSQLENINRKDRSSGS